MPASIQAPRKKRVRLSPEVRKQKILEAALVEFSEHGFGAATVERIAGRADLSKAGLYAHFSSKDEIFQALLTQVLRPPFEAEQWQLLEGESLRGAIDRFIDLSYENLLEPRTIATLRLLIGESARAHDTIRLWRDEVILPYQRAQQAVVNLCVASGWMRESVLTRHFELVSAPTLYAALHSMLFQDGEAAAEIKALREAHRQLLHELLLNDKDAPPARHATPMATPGKPAADAPSAKAGGRAARARLI